MPHGPYVQDGPNRQRSSVGPQGKGAHIDAFTDDESSACQEELTTKGRNPLCNGGCGKHAPPVAHAEAGRYPGQYSTYDGGHDDRSDPYQPDHLGSKGNDNGGKGKGDHDGGDDPS